MRMGFGCNVTRCGLCLVTCGGDLQRLRRPGYPSTTAQCQFHVAAST